VAANLALYQFDKIIVQYLLLDTAGITLREYGVSAQRYDDSFSSFWHRYFVRFLSVILPAKAHN
jgi:hypothetical protein